MNREFSNDDLFDIDKINKHLMKQYCENRRKWVLSRFFFIFLNISCFIMSSVVVIMTMFIIERNVGGQSIKMLFVTISVLTSFVALITGIGSFFQLKTRKNIYIKKIEELKSLVNLLEEAKINDQSDSIIKITQKLETINSNSII